MPFDDAKVGRELSRVKGVLRQLSKEKNQQEEPPNESEVVRNPDFSPDVADC